MFSKKSAPETSEDQTNPVDEKKSYFRKRQDDRSPTLGSNFTPKPKSLGTDTSIIMHPSHDKRETAHFEKEKTLVVGKDVSLSCTIDFCKYLDVEGTLTAELADGNYLYVHESGKVKGTIEVDNAKIAGSYDGELRVRNCLHITKTGKINGTIHYGKLEIEPEGVIQGNILPIAKR